MNRKSLSLMTGVAAAALVIAAPTAFAQTAVSQSATNSAAITNNPGTLTLGAGDLGLGASAAISTSGAVSSTSATAINQTFNMPALGAVTQSSSNTVTGTISNEGTLTIGAGADGERALVANEIGR